MSTDTMDLDLTNNNNNNNKYLSDLPKDLEEEEYAEFEWHVLKYSQLREQAQRLPEQHSKVYSQSFQTKSGDEWRLLMFPNGNNSEQLSLYLDHVNSERGDKCVQLAIKLSNSKDPDVYINKEAQHRFNKDESDWGFTNFVRISQLTQPIVNGKQLVVDDEFKVTVYMRLIKDETGILWHNFNQWESRRETGYIGLKNQGATCYMNSLLQSLYFTTALRKAVYQIPTESETDATKSVALALQRVFYNLQTQETDAVDTRELTKSFGWDTMDAFMQHDVQEFNRVLQDNLEQKMKQTPVEGSIEKLFVGKMKSYIKCVNVDYESSREETFYDIQLNVKGMKNLLESFQDYIQVERLDGDNRYQSDKYGLQEAEKGVIFTQFPPVLHLQLKRFEYDFERDQMIKINDYFEYPDEINLKDYSTNKQQDQVYKLVGVLVHCGDVSGGHYCAFLRPSIQGKWFKFDDDRVIPVTEKQVFQENFGYQKDVEEVNINNSNTNMGNKRQQLLKRFTNAYMLVYIRQDDIGWVLEPITQIPQHLIDQINRERLEKEQKLKEIQERHENVYIRIISDTDLIKCGFDFSVPDRGTIVKVKRTEIIPREISQGRELFVFYRRQNKTIRPEQKLSKEITSSVTVEQLYSKYSINLPELPLLSLPKVYRLSSVTNSTDSTIIIFIKYYDAKAKELSFLFAVEATQQTLIQDLCPLIQKHVNLPQTGELLVFEEIKPTMINQLKLKMSVKEAELITGDVLSFQLATTDKQDLITTFYEHLQQLVHLEFFIPSTNQVTRVKCLRKDLFSQVLPTDKNISFALFAQSANNSRIKLTFNPQTTVHEILSSFFYQNNLNLYKFICEVEQIQEPQLSIFVIDQHLRQQQIQLKQVLLDNNNNLANQNYSFFQFKNSRQLKRVPETTPVSECLNDLFLFKNPADDNDLSINCFHFNKDLNNTHSIPFHLHLPKTTLSIQVGQLKKKIQQKLLLSDKDLQKLQICVVDLQVIKIVKQFQSDQDLVSLPLNSDLAIGLDYPQKITHQEKSIKILN